MGWGWGHALQVGWGSGDALHCWGPTWSSRGPAGGVSPRLNWVGGAARSASEDGKERGKAWVKWRCKDRDLGVCTAPSCGLHSRNAGGACCERGD